MARFRNKGRNDQQDSYIGDRYFNGVDMRRDPAFLPEGMASEAINKRFDKGVARDRGGFLPVKWGLGEPYGPNKIINKTGSLNQLSGGFFIHTKYDILGWVDYDGSNYFLVTERIESDGSLTRLASTQISELYREFSVDQDDNIVLARATGDLYSFSISEDGSIGTEYNAPMSFSLDIFPSDNLVAVATSSTVITVYSYDPSTGELSTALDTHTSSYTLSRLRTAEIDGVNVLFYSGNGSVDAIQVGSDGTITDPSHTASPGSAGSNSFPLAWDSERDRLVVGETNGGTLIVTIYGYDTSSGFTLKTTRNFSSSLTTESLGGARWYASSGYIFAAGNQYCIIHYSDDAVGISRWTWSDNLSNRTSRFSGALFPDFTKRRVAIGVRDVSWQSTVTLVSLGWPVSKHLSYGGVTDALPLYNPVTGRTSALLVGHDELRLCGESEFYQGILRQDYQKPSAILDVTQAFDQVFCFKGFSANPLRWDITKNNRLVEDTDVPNATQGIYLNDRLWVVSERDRIWASDILDPTTFNTSNRFNINYGGFDAITALTPLTSNRLVIFKDRSIFLLNNVKGALSDTVLDTISDKIGCIAKDSAINTGDDILFLSQRGVYTVRQALEDRLQADTKPITYPVQPLIDRINLRAASGACAAYYDNRYYLAVPIDNSTTNNATIVLRNDGGQWICEGYDTWESSDFDVKQFFRAEEAGEDRLYAVSATGFVYWYETKCLNDDRINDTRYPMVSKIVTRGYHTQPLHSRSLYTWLQLETWNPQYTIKTIADGVSEEDTVTEDKTKSRTASYYSGVAAWSSDNANDDFATSGREDYSVVTGSGIQFGSGLTLGLRQGIEECHRIRSSGRFIQLEVTNEQGSLDVVGTTISQQRNRKNLLTKV